MPKRLYSLSESCALRKNIIVREVSRFVIQAILHISNYILPQLSSCHVHDFSRVEYVDDI